MSIMPILMKIFLIFVAEIVPHNNLNLVFMNKILFSSASDEWSTPQDLFNKLDSEFYFTLDPCATSENAKCDSFYDKMVDGLKQPWSGSVFCNPPYSDIKSWVKKCFEERLNCRVIVLLVPSRTDTSWFHDYLLDKAELRFIRGRLKFGDSKNSAPFPSLIAILRC